MRFHLSNTTWRNLRFAFLGDAKGAYSALLPIGIVVAAGAVSGLSMLISPFLGMGLLILTMLGFYGIGPYIQYRLRRYYTAGARAGTSEFGLHIGVGQYYLVYLVAVGFCMMAIGAVASVLIAMTWRGHRNRRYQRVTCQSANWQQSSSWSVVSTWPAGGRSADSCHVAKHRLARYLAGRAALPL